MPEATAAPFEVEIPSDVPIREGEESSQAMLNLEDRRRRDSMLDSLLGKGDEQDLRAELVRRLKELQGTAVGEAMTKFASAKSAARRQRILRSKRAELKKGTFWREDHWEGPCAPATVINLNPIELRLYGELARWSIPKAGDGKKLKISFNGRAFVASYMTLSDPHVWAATTGVSNDNLAGFDATTIEPRYIPPIGLAHQFFSHYVVGANDAQFMGGIVIFEGDIHTLDANRVKKNSGHIWVPKANASLDGSGEVVYTVEKESFADCLERALVMQKDYASNVIAEGHGYANSNADLIKNQLTKYHILWHNFALAQGYKTEAEDWASEVLKDSPSTEAIFCPDCHTRQEKPDQYFCRNCNSPFDACKAFLAGKTVSMDRLVSYPSDSEEFKLIMAETRRRKANIAMLELPEEPAKGKKKHEDS